MDVKLTFYVSYGCDWSQSIEMFDFIRKVFVLRESSKTHQSSLGVTNVVDLGNFGVQCDVIHEGWQIYFCHLIPAELPESSAARFVVDVGVTVSVDRTPNFKNKIHML